MPDPITTDKAPRPDVEGIVHGLRTTLSTVTASDEWWSKFRAVCAYALELEKQLSICNGTFEGELDGKPVSGTLMDGTDGACPGWWRGQKHGCEQMKSKFSAQLYGKYGLHDLQARREKGQAIIRKLRKRIADLLPMTEYGLIGAGFSFDRMKNPGPSSFIGYAHGRSILKAQYDAAREAVDAEKEGGGR